MILEGIRKPIGREVMRTVELFMARRTRRLSPVLIISKNDANGAVSQGQGLNLHTATSITREHTIWASLIGRYRGLRIR